MSHHNHNHSDHGHSHDESHAHGEDHSHAHARVHASATVTSTDATGIVNELASKDISPKMSAWFASMGKRLTHSVTAGEIILFIAAVALFPLLITVMSTVEILGKYSVITLAALPVIFLAVAFYFSQDKERPVGIFFHSAAAIGLMVAAISLLPQLGIFSPMLMGLDGIALGMPILAIVFLLAAAHLPNSGASYHLAATAAIVIFFYATAYLLTYPCASQLFAGNPEASTFCSATPFIPNIFLSVVLYTLGYFAYTKRAK